jgi:hypothetical protein
VLLVLAGTLAMGLLGAVYARTADADASMRATHLAQAISEGMNCGALGLLVGLVAGGVREWRRRAPAARPGPG